MHATDMTTRRTFLHRGLTLVAASATVPTFLERSALAVGPTDGALTTSRPGVPDDHVLVVVQLAGGNDGLNTVIPLDQFENYFNARENIHIREDKVLPLNGIDHLGLHTRMTGMQQLYNEGKLAVVQNVGYPHPNFSHFRGTDIWMTAADHDEFLNTGWNAFSI